MNTGCFSFFICLTTVLLELSKPVSSAAPLLKPSSPSYSNGYFVSSPPANAVDSNTATHVYTYHNKDGFLVFGFDKAYDVEKVIIETYGSIYVSVLIGSSFRSDCLDTSKTMSFLDTFTECGKINGELGSRSFNCPKPKSPARYVGLRVTKPSSIHIKEIQANGVVAANQDVQNLKCPTPLLTPSSPVYTNGYFAGAEPSKAVDRNYTSFVYTHHNNDAFIVAEFDKAHDIEKIIVNTYGNIYVNVMYGNVFSPDSADKVKLLDSFTTCGSIAGSGEKLITCGSPAPSSRFVALRVTKPAAIHIMEIQAFSPEPVVETGKAHSTNFRVFWWFEQTNRHSFDFTFSFKLPLLGKQLREEIAKRRSVEASKISLWENTAFKRSDGTLLILSWSDGLSYRDEKGERVENHNARDAAERKLDLEKNVPMAGDKRTVIFVHPA